MDISIVGSGYVGTTIAACFAELGHTVTTIDIDEDIVKQINAGEPPIHEPGLDSLIATHGGNRLTATKSYDIVPETAVTILALPTPPTSDGSIDLSYMETGAEAVGTALDKVNNEHQHVIVTKSTVVPTTTEEKLVPAIESAAISRGTDFFVAANPEFQREGSAVSDFLNPDKLVLGTADPVASERLRELYDPLREKSETEVPLVETGIAEAEMIKYANNTFLASKVSLINDIGNICKQFDVDAYEVADAIGLDDRISERFLRSGVGWGGSCFGKDTKAIIAAAKSTGYQPKMLSAAITLNEHQPRRLVELVEKHTTLSGSRVAVLGLAFKPGTDDIRDSQALPVIEILQERDAEIVAYDPVATEPMREQIPQIEYAQSARNALAGAHAAVVLTGWDEFASLDAEFAQMESPIVVDGRRIIEPSQNIVYEGMTW